MLILATSPIASFSMSLSVTSPKVGAYEGDGSALGAGSGAAGVSGIGSPEAIPLSSAFISS